MDTDRETKRDLLAVMKKADMHGHRITWAIVAGLFAVVMATSGMIVSSMRSDIDALRAERNDTSARITRLEESQAYMREAVVRIETKLDRVLEEKGK